MKTVQLATRVDVAQDERFRELTRELGTTPADAIRVFISEFNNHRGFPFDVHTVPDWEPFATEAEALDWVSEKSLEILDEAW